MEQHSEHILSSAFNTSMGFIPVIISIALCEFISQDFAIYIGTGAGILGICLNLFGRGKRIPNFILWVVTGLLGILSLTTLFPSGLVPPEYFPITLEASLLLLLQTFFLYKKEFLNRLYARQKKGQKRLYAKGGEASIVGTRMALILGTLHLIIICIVLICSSPSGISPRVREVIFNQIPLWIFVLCIAFNQFAIWYFNRLVNRAQCTPIIDKEGNVLGKTFIADAVLFPDPDLHPVIRIALVTQGRLYLSSRSEKTLVDAGKRDTPIETFLLCSEEIEDGIHRIIEKTFPALQSAPRKYVTTYHFQNELTNRLVYLFLIEVEDESLLRTPKREGSKIWNLEQIKDNLGKNYFSSCLEKEFYELERVICKEEKCKES